jgi:hypothetical protein
VLLLGLACTSWACRPGARHGALRAEEQCPPPRDPEIRVSEDSIAYLPLFDSSVGALRTTCPAATDTIVHSGHGEEYPAVKFVIGNWPFLAVLDPLLGESAAAGYWMVPVPSFRMAQARARVGPALRLTGVSEQQKVAGGLGLTWRYSRLLNARMTPVEGPNQTRSAVKVILPRGVPVSAAWSELQVVYGVAEGSSEMGEVVVTFCNLPRFAFVLSVQPDVVGSPEVSGDLSRIPADARINRIEVFPPPSPEFARFEPPCPRVRPPSVPEAR